MSVVNPDNLVMGPATIYWGAFGATEPTDATVNDTPQASAWNDMGGTEGGASFDVSSKYTNLQVDQIVDIPGARLTERMVTVTTKLAEPTLENLAFALNDGTAGSGSGYKTYDPNYASSATQPTYHALILDGWAPGSFRRRLIVRKVLSTAGIKYAYNKGTQSVFDVTFSCFYVSSVIPPFHLVDATA